MFARQIAVMKGQAWNVVETLKTSDHGPLELTRRTRVCVWDDLVDIPVAIPMRAPSTELRRKRDREEHRNVEQEEEEMDISAAIASAPAPQHDLLGLSSPTTDLPNPNRFDLSRDNSTSDLGHAGGVDTPMTIHGPVVDHQAELDEAKLIYAHNTRPSATRSKTRLSFEGHRKNNSSGSRRRRFSHSTRQGGTGYVGDGDELEGDLGYSAAEGMEGSQRKVIVERLETVKSKNPVFTWC